MNLTTKATKLLAASLVFAAAACGDDGGNGPNGNGTPDAGPTDTGGGADLVSIAISPDPVSVEVGASVQLTVTGTFDDSSTDDVTDLATFASNDENTALVDSNGSVFGVEEGTAMVSADVDGVSASVSITVTPGQSTDPTIPMAIDDFFTGRAGFSEAGAPLHTEDEDCPERAVENAAGVCHRFVWDGTGGPFTGTFWIDGGGFGDINPVAVEEGATEVSFYAWSDSGGEVIEFGAGIPDAPPAGDGAAPRVFITLTDTPTRYFVPLGALEGYTEVYGAFIVAIAAGTNPNGATFYVDDIQWTEGEGPTEVALPMTVDEAFTGRAGFSEAGAPLHTEDEMCPERGVEGAVGTCHRFTWDGTGGPFTGAFWINGEGFGSLSPVAVEGGATEVSFYAWGENGGEVIEFGAGIPDAPPAGDGAAARTFITLSTIPTRYSVQLTELAGYSDVYGAFITAIAAGSNPNGATYYVDDIQWQVGEPPGDDLVVFDDNFGNGITFAPFGGSMNDIAPDATMPQSGAAALRISVPDTSYTGGALIASSELDLSAFNAVTFWARADADNALNVVGVGDDATTNPFRVERTALALTSTWQQFTIPIPDPTVMTAENGLFHFAEGSEHGAYTIWLDDIILTNLDNISNPRAAIATETIPVEAGATFTPNGMNVIFDVGGTDVQVFPRAPHFEWASSDVSVATIDANGLGTAVAQGTAEITAEYAGIAAGGTLTVNVAAPQLPTVAAPTPPSRNAADVISLFSDAYTDIAVETFSAPWDQADVDDIMVAGDNVKRYRNHVFAGIEFIGPTVDATDMTTLHVDLWTPDATRFVVRLVNDVGGPNFEQSDVVFDGTTTPAVVTGQWISFDIPLSDFTGLSARDDLDQMLLLTEDGTPRTLVIDNLYFYR